jgi:hypothetical protein
MNHTVKEFYAQDASIKALGKNEQICRFNEWANKKELNLGLTFKERIETKWLIRIYIVLVVIYFGAYFLNEERLFHPELLIGLALIQLLLRQEIPTTYEVDQDSIVNSVTAPPPLRD